MTDQEKFFAFLDKHGCKEKWVKNVEECWDTYVEFLSINPSADWIDCAFNWDDTPEGEAFWCSIAGYREKEIAND